MKKKTLIILVAVLAVVGILIGFFVGTYNGLVEASAEVENAQSQIQVQLQRRADLIPNFVATVKGYSDYEKETFTAVTNARAAVSKATSVDEMAAADAQLNGAIDVWVNAVTEAYPELKANSQYIALQDELAGTENRVAKARSNYNEAAKKYNVSVRKFPKNLLASMYGFETVPLFEADDSASSVPQVSFD